MQRLGMHNRCFKSFLRQCNITFFIYLQLSSTTYCYVGFPHLLCIHFNWTWFSVAAMRWDKWKTTLQNSSHIHSSPVNSFVVMKTAENIVNSCRHHLLTFAWLLTRFTLTMVSRQSFPSVDEFRQENMTSLDNRQVARQNHIGERKDAESGND